MPPSFLAPKPMGRRGAAFCSLPCFLCLAVTWLRQKGLPRCEHGLAQPHTCPQATVPQVPLAKSGVSPTLRTWGWPCCNPLVATGCPTAGVSSAPGHIVPHPLEPVAIEGPRLPSAGSAAQEQQEPGSALLEVAPEECVLILLGSQGIAHPRGSPWPLVACPHGRVFQGTGQAAHSHLDRAAPALPHPHCSWARMSFLPSLWGLKCWPLAQNPL